MYSCCVPFVQFYLFFKIGMRFELHLAKIDINILVYALQSHLFRNIYVSRSPGTVVPIHLH